MNKELPVTQHNEMVQGYVLALAANTVFDLRNKKAVENAKAIVELLVRNPDPIQDNVTNALKEAAEVRDTYTNTFDGLVESASALMPARQVFDNSEIEFSTASRYAGPPGI